MVILVTMYFVEQKTVSDPITISLLLSALVHFTDLLIVKIRNEKNLYSGWERDHAIGHFFTNEFDWK